MKKVFFLLSVLCLASCNKNEDTGLDSVKGFDPADRMEAFTMRKNLAVPAKEGHKTVVLYKGDTVLTTNFPTEIALPEWDVNNFESGLKSSNAFSNVIEIYFVATNEGDPNFPVYKSRSERQQFILAFEDLEPGDNDYNDLIIAFYEDIEARYDRNTNKTKLKVASHGNPLAAGGTLDLDFGVDVYVRHKDGSFELFKEVMLYEKIHQTMLAGKGVNPHGSVQEWAYNTGCNWLIAKDGKYVKKEECQDVRFDSEEFVYDGDPFAEGKGFYFNYFIKVYNRYENRIYKHYVAETSREVGQYDYTVDGNGNAYGLLIPKGANVGDNREGYIWPFETADIFLAYPNFKEWVAKGNRYTDPFANKNGRYLIPDINQNPIDIFDPAQTELFADEKYAKYRPTTGGSTPEVKPETPETPETPEEPEENL